MSDEWAMAVILFMIGWGIFLLGWLNVVWAMSRIQKDTVSIKTTLELVDKSLVQISRSLSRLANPSEGVKGLRESTGSQLDGESGED